MDVKKIIEDIELYLNLYSLPESCSNKPLPIEFKQFISGDRRAYGAHLTNGNNPDFEGIHFFASILSRCSEETLFQLMEECGEMSELGQLIRKELAKRHRNICRFDSKTIQRNIEEAIGTGDRQKSNPFYEAVCEYIDAKGFKSDADFYNSIFMPRQLFARLRDPNTNLSKKTVLWIVVGLGLDYPEASAVLGLAGYCFRKNDKRDVVLSYILRNTKYDLFTVNEILDHFGCEPFC